MARLLVILLLVFLVAVYGQKSREQRARPDAAEDFEKPRQSSHGKDKSRGEYRARHGVFSKTDKSDWVDSGDMFNYDHSTKQMKKPSTKGTTGGRFPGTAKPHDDEPSLRNSCPPCSCSEKKCDCASAQNDLATCQHHKKGCQVDYALCLERLEEKPPSETAYLKQLVAVFYRHLVDTDDLPYPEEYSYYSAYIGLSGEDLQEMSHYAQHGGDDVKGVHHVLTKMIQEIHRSEQMKPPTWNDKLADFWTNHSFIFLSIVSCCVCFYSISQIILAQWRNPVPFFKLLLVFGTLTFFVSFGWNWWVLYMEEYAKHMKQLAVPPDCREVEDASMWITVANWFKGRQAACDKYYRSMYVSPVFEVPPTKVLARTITQFCVEPLEHVGKAFGKMLKGLTDELPWYLWGVGIPSLLALLIFTMLVFNGSRFNFFHLISIEPGQHDVERKMLKSRVEELQVENRELRDIADRRASLPAPVAHPPQPIILGVPTVQRALSYPVTTAIYPGQEEPSELRHRGRQPEPRVEEVPIDSMGGGDRTEDRTAVLTESVPLRKEERRQEQSATSQPSNISPVAERKEPVFIDLTSPKSKSVQKTSDTSSGAGAVPASLAMGEAAAAADFPSPQSSSTSSKDITPCSESSEDTMLLGLHDQEMMTSTGSYVQVFTEKPSPAGSAGESDSDIEVIEPDKTEASISLD